ncbi:hypothetical protein [Reichenbachiella ulvae]|uniref:Uncharacterized protein n=1 Tax=Reichenbachiella ulvae TaxID=2980104 RepID=A0ABT3CYZ1_9BACT|nr:hypothetical protein [Reichenbachiella ulvae]MCV9388710.1 hypothetical protein [Reichenbachiella ulvae]
MFLLQFPPDHPHYQKTLDFFKENSLAHQAEVKEDVTVPQIVKGEKVYEGIESIEQLLNELKDYYGGYYNCSCAR